MQSVCEAKLLKLMSMRCIYAFLVTEQAAPLPTNAMQRTFLPPVADGECWAPWNALDCLDGGGCSHGSVALSLPMAGLVASLMPINPKIILNRPLRS